MVQIMFLVPYSLSAHLEFIVFQQNLYINVKITGVVKVSLIKFILTNNVLLIEAIHLLIHHTEGT